MHLFSRLLVTGVGKLCLVQVDDPPEIESMEDEVLLIAWKDKTMAEINELVLLSVCFCFAHLTCQRNRSEQPIGARRRRA